jgi:MFS family permease
VSCETGNRAAAAYLGFAVFGSFWGSWGASVPAIRDQAGITDGQLGTALLCIGAGALPAMPVAGRLVDRWGTRVAAALLTALGLAGILVAATAHDLVSLSVGLAVLGAVSGAADVAINAVAGSAQATTGAPVIGRAHATFSAAVVVCSLAAGGARATGMPLVVTFAVLASGALATAIVLAHMAPSPSVSSHRATDRRTTKPRVGPVRPLVVLGGLGALAFAVENGHQSWSALYLGDVLDAGPTAAAAGPAVFAAIVAVARWSTAGISTRRPAAVLLGGCLLATAGTTALASATSVGLGLLALAVAATGTAVLFPTLLSVLSSRVPEGVRGAATSVVATIAYLGFLAGPVYVGRWADAVELPGAMLALAALAATLAVLAPISVHRLTNASAAGTTGALTSTGTAPQLTP